MFCAERKGVPDSDLDKLAECFAVDKEVEANQLKEVPLHRVDLFCAEELIADLAPCAVCERLVVEELACEHQADKEESMWRVEIYR